MMYLSADNPIIGDTPFGDIVEALYQRGYAGVIIDEVHYLKDWSFQAKAAYDSYPEFKVWLSDSSSLVLRYGGADLSRRFLPIRMPYLSFREYLHLETGKIYPRYEFGGTEPPMCPDSPILRRFREYRDHGACPYYLEGDFEERALAALNKSIHSDVPFFVKSVSDGNLRTMTAVAGTLARSPVPRINVSGLCSRWALGADKLYELLRVMEEIGLIRTVRYPNDFKAASVGAKMFFENFCLYPVLGGENGNEREAFVATCFASAGWTVNAVKDERTGDLLVSRAKSGASYKIEIGGRNKHDKGADYVLRDDTDYPCGNSVPFWMLGMMW